jgi:NAD-dependent deacetylase
MSEAEAIARFRGWLGAARSGVVFTGAGISTESGIPDFRSPGGIWQKFRPIDFGEFMASAAARKEAWRRRFASSCVLDAATPNRGHAAVAELVRRGSVHAVITQNVDGLHQASGVPDHQVIEIHGNTTYARCLGCERRFELEDVRVRFEESGECPTCEDCGGFLKTATISFGQAMPALPMRRAEEAARSADLFVAIGSSLVVYPAAALPALARRSGARLVILNREPTDLDGVADLVVRGEIGPVLEAAVGHTASDG